MNPCTLVLAVFLMAYVARVAGAVLSEDTKRSRAREVTDALALPITMFTSKHKQGYELSGLRVILGIFVGLFAQAFPRPGEWGMWQWAAMATLTFALIVDTLFANVPVREGLAALVAIFGGAVAKRVRKTTVEQTETETPAPGSAAAAPPLAPDFEPHEWADGHPDEGVI